MISSAADWAKSRDQVFNPKLRERGFKGSGPELMASVDQKQLHYVRTDFYVQGFINVGVAIHFDDIAPFRFAGWPGALAPPKLCFESAFLKFRSSLELPGHSSENEKAILAAIRSLLQSLESAARKCGDGNALFALFPPVRLEADLDRIPEHQSLNKEFPGWYPDLGAMLAMLICQSIRSGRADLTAQYLSLASKVDDYLLPNQREFDRFLQEVKSRGQ